MSNIGHVEGWDTDKPFISDSLEATSFHWAAWTGIEDSTEGSYIQGLIELKNTGKFPILDAKVFLDLDDNGMTWDAYLCNSAGTPIEDGFISYGHPIAPGETVKLKYWWGLKHVAGPTKCDFTVTVNMFPEYRVQVPKSNAHQSKTSIQAS
ncbi:hypothetical protein [Microbulbifer variabilis]|uniref:hypothetical protein n=1 Tax=Microbulbifer variabilis TaxID=266805 RepID=UPI001CFDDAF7|nr:hypothetical protein [Microbulbifer variabilis]